MNSTIRYLEIVSNIEGMHSSEHILLSRKHKLIRKINKLIIELVECDIISEENSFFFLNRILEHIDNDTDFADILIEISDEYIKLNSKIEQLGDRVIPNFPDSIYKSHLRKSSILANEVASISLKQENFSLVPYFTSLSYFLLLLSC